MKNRKCLYGYEIKNGEVTVRAKEAVIVLRVITLYLDGGMSYQKIADRLNRDGVPFSDEAPVWNKHKVKRLLENPKYTGTDGYPAITDAERFQAVLERIRTKTAAVRNGPPERPALRYMKYLRCPQCGETLRRTAGPARRKDTLYLKCGGCGARNIIPDAAFLKQVRTQMKKPEKQARRKKRNTLRPPRSYGWKTPSTALWNVRTIRKKSSG